MELNDILREEIVKQRARRPSRPRPTLPVGTTVTVEVEGQAPFKGDKIKIVREGEGAPEAEPVRLAWNTPVARRLSKTRVGEVITLASSDGRSYKMRLLEIDKPILN